MDFEAITFQNPQWTGEKFSTPKFKRGVFAKLKDSLKNRMAVSVCGMRRTGKSTALKQLANHLVENGTNPANTLYYSFDVQNGSPLEVYREWTEKFSIGKTDVHYVFFDEIQNVKDWGAKIKVIYDNTNAKIFLSGSAGLLVRKGQESLAGRVLELSLDPLGFTEYCSLKNTELQGMEWELYRQYIHAQLPELVTTGVSSKEYIGSLIQKVTREDLARYFDAPDAGLAETLFRMVARQPGQIMDYSSLGRELGYNRETIARYLDALENSFLVRKIYNYSGNTRKTEKSSKKFYPYCANLCDYVSPLLADFSLVAETDVAFQTGAQFFYNKNGTEIDFLCGHEALEYAVEVKTKNDVDKRDIRTLISNPVRMPKLAVVTAQGANVRIPKEISNIPLYKAGKITGKQ
jgi:hypothetical protein